MENRKCNRCGKILSPTRWPRKFCSRDCRHNRLSSDPQDRFFLLVGRKTLQGCLLWRGRIDETTGYGYFYPEPRKKCSAHRYSYRVMVGEIPKGVSVLHRCDIRSCINPTHLFLGSQLENIADCVAKRRHAHGSTNGHSVLTEVDVVEIRKRHFSGESFVSIADYFKVHPVTIFDAVKRITWKHVP